MATAVAVDGPISEAAGQYQCCKRVVTGYVEALAERTTGGCFTVAEFVEHSKTGRNFAIELLEYFDRLGFTERAGNNRRIKRPAATVFAVNDEG